MDNELRLLRAMARHDQSAWAVMYDRHVGDVFGVIYHLLGADRGIAEDVCQDVWLLAIERFDRFDPSRGEFRNWLLGIGAIACAAIFAERPKPSLMGGSTSRQWMCRRSKRSKRPRQPAWSARPCYV